jgi:DNA mismatch repair protein MutS
MSLLPDTPSLHVPDTPSPDVPSAQKPMANKSIKLTPLMAQYWDVKAAHPDKIILFRMGDFFEMFHRDAEIAAPVIGIALTSRNKKSQDETPMCGVPHHAVAPAINKLLRAGFKVAICDQLEDPKNAKGLVKRGITRTLSPGVVFDPDTLDAAQTNYLASWDAAGSLAFLDVSTGEAFFFRSVPTDRKWEFIESLGAVEWVLPAPSAEDAERARRMSRSLSTHDSLNWIAADGEKLNYEHPHLNLAELPEAALRLISYAIGKLSNGAGPLLGAAESWIRSLTSFEERGLESRMVLSSSTLRHLEVFGTYRGDVEGSLFKAINRTKTSGGARLLKSWMQFPLVDPLAIERRLDRLEAWYENDQENRKLRSALARVGDLPRRIAKIGQPSRGPRDLLALAESLSFGAEAWSLAVQLDPKLKELALNSIEPQQRAATVASEISRVIADEAPVHVRQGGAIRMGARPDLDNLIRLSTDASRLVLELEARERELTGIASLKVRYNNIFGFSIEITNTHREKVPLDRYDRKQTLANAERYTTRELSQLEAQVLSAEDRRLKLEEEEFQRLVGFVLSESHVLSTFAMELAELDVVSSLGWLALDQRYIRPRFLGFKDAKMSVRLLGSRHPVIEQSLSLPFVANDLELEKGQCLLLTGPNMAGKSTLMRQVAIAVMMAQMGSFVAAEQAELSIFDRVATRIGASDFLAEGLSTFMVEMKETAEILAAATDRTLLVLDEIGRGTATFDGLSLAQAILEHLLKEKSVLTLFATHYHELTELQAKFSKIQTAHMAIAERGSEITFLHRLTSGAAGRSYGIHVAKLAGLPGSVISRAQEILKEVEGSISHSSERVNLKVRKSKCHESAQLPFGFGESGKSVIPEKLLEVLRDIQSFDINRSTPLEALGKISKWAREIPSELH